MAERGVLNDGGSPGKRDPSLSDSGPRGDGKAVASAVPCSAPASGWQPRRAELASGSRRIGDARSVAAR
jgi:hypothetical protein